MDEHSVHRDVLLAFEYSYLHDDWVFPLADSLEETTVEEALWRPAPDAKNIWEIVLHVTTWIEQITDRISSGVRKHPAAGSWPPLPDATNEDAWQGAQRRLWESLAALRVVLEATSLPTLLETGDQDYTYLADLLCRFIHIAYHIGQITKLRECRASQGTGSATD